MPLTGAVHSSDEPGKRGNISLDRIPDNECSSFLLTEVAYLKRLSQNYGVELWPGYYSNNHLDYYFSADVGLDDYGII